jgi:hypothetical protein
VAAFAHRHNIPVALCIKGSRSEEYRRFAESLIFSLGWEDVSFFDRPLQWRHRKVGSDYMPWDHAISKVGEQAELKALLKQK